MKVAISLPDDLFAEAELFAERKALTRSALYAEAIREYLTERRDHRVTEQLNAVYAEHGSSVDVAFDSARSRILDDEAW